MSITAVILTKNEEKNIEACLQKLSWCNEILVIDDFSIDATVKLAKKLKATVIQHALNNDFASQRNFGLQKATGEWVFFVDADERVSHFLKDEISHHTTYLEEPIKGFVLRRQDFLWGKPLMHGDTGDSHPLRLARKGAGKWVGKVHEVWEVQGKIGELSYSLFHYPHPTLTEFLTEINHYSTLRAQELYTQGVRASFLSIYLHPKAKFFQDYFLKCGFLDGIEGFLVAVLMSFHSFLVRGKLWQLGKK